MAFPLDKTEVASLLVEAVLYGLFILLFCCTIYVLVHKRSSPQIHIGMLVATIVLFVLSTIHLVTNFARLMEAFHAGEKQLGAAIKVLGNRNDPKYLLKTIVLVSEIVTGDILLIYRCYVAWGGNIRVIIAPTLIVIGTMVSSAGIVWGFAKLPRPNVFTPGPLHDFIICTQVLVLCNNILCTCLLAWKLWQMSRSMISRSQRETLRSIALIIAQSGVLIAVTWIIFIILFSLNSLAEIIVLDALVPITGCAFCYIVSRVALGLDNDDHLTTSIQIRERDAPSPVIPVLDGTGRTHRPVEISVSSRQSVHVETELEAIYIDKQQLQQLAAIGLV